MASSRQAAPKPKDEARPAPARWNALLRALREASGATQAGWAARIGVGRSTLQRWEAGELAPAPDAEAAIIDACIERGLCRTFYQGPLRGVTITPELLRDLLAEARLSGSQQRQRAVSRRSTTAQRADAGRSSDPPLSTPRSVMPRTSFVGRERELADVRHLLSTVRLVTVTGPGGAGKTRIALRLISDLGEELGPRVWLVDLSVVSEPALVHAGVATALGLREQVNEPPLEAAMRVLHGAPSLLVLDNCEHLVSACAETVDRLLAACSDLRVLATSRQPLGLPDEVSWPLGGLDLPADESSPTDEVAGSGAVRLFVERASVVRPDFRLDEQARPAVVRICRRLDGLPLAIELAAARVRVLAPSQIADRLDDHLSLLSSPHVTTAPRQQTLRATLDWSHDLLAEPERAVLRRLSVFAGGCTLEAAEAVVHDAATPSVLDILTSLVAKSLVVADVPADAARYRLLETVRQYALARLAEADEVGATRDRHLQWCLGLAEAAEPHLRGAEQASWLDRLEAEIENLRAALGWALPGDGEQQRVDRVEAGLRLAAALRWFWFTRGRPAEGRRRLERGLELGAALPAAVRARALDGAAALAHNQGDYAAARQHQEAAYALWQAEDDRRGMATSRSTLGIIAKAQGEHDRARGHLEAALSLAREAGEHAIEATALNNLAALAMDVSDYSRAHALLEESLAIKRRLGDAAGIATSLHNLGDTALHLGELERAIGFLSESLGLFRRLGASDRIAQTLHSLGSVALRHGDVDAADAQIREALALFEQAGDEWGEVLCTEGLALVAAARNDARAVAMLFGAADAWREANAAPVPPNDRADYDRALAAARTQLDQALFQMAWAEGRARGLPSLVLAHD